MLNRTLEFIRIEHIKCVKQWPSNLILLIQLKEITLWRNFYKSCLHNFTIESKTFKANECAKNTLAFLIPWVKFCIPVTYFHYTILLPIRNNLITKFYYICALWSKLISSILILLWCMYVCICICVLLRLWVNTT